MKFLKLLLVSMALGHFARPFLLTATADKLAFVCLMIWLVMAGARAAEKKAPIHPAANRLLSLLRQSYVMPAALIYALSWLYARTTLSRLVVEILQG